MFALTWWSSLGDTYSTFNINTQEALFEPPVLKQNLKPHRNKKVLGKIQLPKRSFTMFLRSCAFIYLLSFSASAFAPSKLHAPLTLNAEAMMQSKFAPSPLVLFSENKKKGGLDGNMRTKLLSESIAPWRTLRLFFYGSLGSGAFVGGLITISGAIAGSNSPDFNLDTEVGSFK